MKFQRMLQELLHALEDFPGGIVGHVACQVRSPEYARKEFEPRPRFSRSIADGTRANRGHLTFC